jgi:hypothetical protein
MKGQLRWPLDAIPAAGLCVAHALSTVKAARINWAITPWQPRER